MKRKLTQEQILFIDNYLRNSGVRYADIRFEMTDHVAAALENIDGDFYEDFRLYMIRNKRDLLASNRTFRKLAWKKALKVIQNNLISLPFWIVTALIFACAKIVEAYVGAETVTDNLHMVMMACSTPVFLYFWYYRMFRLNTNSVIHKLLIIVYFGSIFFRMDRLVENNVTLLLFYFSFSIAFMLMLIRSLFQLNRKIEYNG